MGYCIQNLSSSIGWPHILSRWRGFNFPPRYSFSIFSSPAFMYNKRKFLVLKNNTPFVQLYLAVFDVARSLKNKKNI